MNVIEINGLIELSKNEKLAINGGGKGRLGKLMVALTFCYEVGYQLGIAAYHMTQ